VFDVQGVILTAATLFIFVIQAWAFLDAISHRPEAFVAADKMTKKAWLVILGVALAAHMVFWHPINLINIIGTIAALVYMLDARPVLRSLTRR
jgi:predicted transcriptional regulator